MFNKHVISIKKINPDGVMNRSSALCWIRRNKWGAFASLLGVTVDIATITLSVIEDGYKFGPSTTPTLAEIAGGAAGALIGSAIGSILPGIGTTIGSFLGSLIGSLIANGVTSFFLGYTPTAPGPGQPLLDTDPREAVFEAPSLGIEDCACSGQPSLGLATGFQGAPDTEWSLDDDFPQMDYETM